MPIKDTEPCVGWPRYGKLLGNSCLTVVFLLNLFLPSSQSVVVGGSEHTVRHTRCGKTGTPGPLRCS